MIWAKIVPKSEPNAVGHWVQLDLSPTLAQVKHYSEIEKSIRKGYAVVQTAIRRPEQFNG